VPLAPLLLLVLLLAAGCGRGAETAGEDGARAAAPAPGEHGVADEGPGEVLLRFVRAARERDADATLALLSEETRASIAPEPDRFPDDAGARLEREFARLTGERVTLSRRLDDRLGVAAIAGRRPPREGAEPEEWAYAAALLREGGRWRVELGGLVVGGVSPGWLAEAEADTALRARAEAAAEVERMLAWVDGEPLAGTVTSDLRFTAQIEGRPPRPLAPGLHRAVVLAVAGDTAGAVAWPFVVPE
jgi:hypothetical protein